MPELRSPEGRGPIAELLSLDHAFVVPCFQRFYTWEAPLVTAFWQHVSRPTRDGYRSIGRVSLSSSNDQIHVIDGQQRLTTILLLLIALRDYAEDRSLKELTARLDGLISTPEGQPRIRSNEPNILVLIGNFCARNPISPRQHTPATEAIIAAHETLKSLVEAMFKGLDAKAVRRDITRIIANLLDDDFELSVCLTTEENGAYKAENALGDPLSEMDQIKNHILGSTSPRQLPDLSRRLNGVLARHKGDALSDLARTYLATHGIRKYASGIYPAYEEYVSRQRLGAAVVVAEVERLSDLIEMWRSANFDLPAEYNLTPKALEALRFLAAQAPKSWLRPVVFAALDPESPFRKRDLSSLLSLLRVVWVRNAIAAKGYGVAPGTFNGRMIDIAGAIYAGKITTAAAVQDELAVFSNDEPFLKHLRIVSFSDRSTEHALAREVLRGIECDKMAGQGAGYVLDPNLTLEHIFPTNPSNWIQHLSAEELVGLQGEHGSLGNLLLLTKDQQEAAGTANFGAKRKVYDDSSLLLCADPSLRVERWTADEIQARQEVLATQVVRAFGWPTPSSLKGISVSSVVSVQQPKDVPAFVGASA